MKKGFLILVAIMIVAWVKISNLQAREKDTDTIRVSGIVTDHMSVSMPGVTITVKGTEKSTVSDINGKYSLSVPENAILQFSFVGYVAQEIVVEMQRVIDVVMMESEVLLNDEVVVSIVSTGIEPVNPINLTVKQRKKAEVDNYFAFRMFREVSKQDGVNTFFSPFSLNMVLGMLYNGSSGHTRAEIIKVLGIADFSESEINEYYQILSHALLEIDPMTDISIANSIWYRNILPVKSTFIETNKKYFDAEIQALDFKNPNVANIINNWCAEKTKNRINHIVGNLISHDMTMYLVNALYFKSKWQMEKRFDKADTKLSDFTNTNHQKKKVNMMEQSTFLPYFADQHLQCVELPYGNQAFSMIAILPSENMKDINELIKYLPDTNWQDIVNSMQQQRVWLKLPRFKMECNLQLNQPVRNLGLKQIFKNGGFANISNKPLAVSNMIQKTFVEVNEEGTEAAAVTAIPLIVGYVGTPTEPVHFFADRPFLILIREKSTGVVLFIGRIDEPAQ